MPAPEIDREKLRGFVRKLRKGDHLLLLDRAIDLLPKSRLHMLVQGYVRPHDLKPDAPSETPFSATVLEQKSQNWLVKPADTPGVSFYLRPKGYGGIESMTGKTVTVSVTKAWRHRGRLYVTGTMAG